MYKIFEIDTTLNTNEQNYLTGKCIVLHSKNILKLIIMQL